MLLFFPKLMVKKWSRGPEERRSILPIPVGFPTDPVVMAAVVHNTDCQAVSRPRGRSPPVTGFLTNHAVTVCYVVAQVDVWCSLK